MINRLSRTAVEIASDTVVRWLENERKDSGGLLALRVQSILIESLGEVPAKQNFNNFLWKTQAYNECIHWSGLPRLCVVL